MPTEEFTFLKKSSNNKNKLFKKRYKIIDELGVGGAGIVYLAYDTVNNKNVAIKILKPKKNNLVNEKNKYRLMQEAKFISQFTSNNIVKIYDIDFQSDTYPYFVMEYISGQTLKDMLKKRGRLGQLEAIYIIENILNALKEIHKHNLVHRDIKPSNIIITDEGNIKILDFGIMLNNEEHLNLTDEGNVIGSVQYIAPEIIKENNITYLADFYSLGIIFFELLTGRSPYIAKNVQVILQKHVTEPIPNILKINPNISQNVAEIIYKCVAKNYNERFQSANDLKKALHLAKLSIEDKNISSSLSQNIKNKKTFYSKFEKKEQKLFKNWKIIIGTFLIFFLIIIIILIVLIVKKV